jgi:4-amino-4-deoxy-L-arabinose transferase-like glycosyltransferase
MNLQIKLPGRESTLVLILVSLFLITRIPLLFYLPFIQDESLYAIMIDEQAGNPTLIPTLFGYPISWKPAPFFWIHIPFNELPLPLEARYRLPSMLFGLATIPILFRFFRNMGQSRYMAFFTLLVFIFSFVTAYPHAALLTDSMLFFFISSALLIYSEKRFCQWRFLIAGLLAFAAFWTKLVVAAVIPILAVAYFLSFDRKTLRNPIFLLSLLAVPAAFTLHYALYDAAGLAQEVYFSDIGGHLLSREGISGQLDSLIGSLFVLLEGAGIWFALSLFGFWKYWRDNLFMSLWFLLSVFPLLSGSFMPWYFLPVFPAIAFFSVKLLLIWKGRERMDTLFWAFIIMAILLTTGLCAFLYSSHYEGFIDQKEAGLYLANKENVAVVGTYNPAILTYKMLNEEEPLDVGWILASRNITEDEVRELAQDYHTDNQEISQGSFSPIFTTASTYRKDTNIPDFDYVAVVWKGGLDPGGELVFNRSSIQIYRMND